MASFIRIAFLFSVLPLLATGARAQTPTEGSPAIKVDHGKNDGTDLPFTLSTVDLSGDTQRQVVVAAGTKDVYNGQVSTVLLPDGKTIYSVWTYNHGGPCGPMKRSDDGGLTWSPLLELPGNWSTVGNSPSIFRLSDTRGKSRLFVFAGRGPGEGKGPDGAMHQAYSEDDGKTWTPMTPNGLRAVMPFCTVVPVEGGAKLIALTNMRRPGDKKRSNVVAQSVSTDGGLTWSPLKIVVDLPALVPCEPAVVRSPDGKQLLCLMRENAKRQSLYMTSDDEGKTWSETKLAPVGLAGDRHITKYARDGRLVVCFRDRAGQSGTLGHYVAWVGTYQDIVQGKEGQYRIKLLHNYSGVDCGYSGVELLPDDTFVATTYLKYKQGPEKHSIVSTRFKLQETDSMLRK